MLLVGRMSWIVELKLFPKVAYLRKVVNKNMDTNKITRHVEKYLLYLSLGKLKYMRIKISIKQKNRSRRTEEYLTGDVK